MREKIINKTNFRVVNIRYGSRAVTVRRVSDSGATSKRTYSGISTASRYRLARAVGSVQLRSGNVIEQRIDRRLLK